MNISSYEVEAEVSSHPLVKDVAAIAVKNPDLEQTADDEEVKVCVVLEQGADLDPADLIEYLAGRMPRHWVPRYRRVHGRAAENGVAQAQEGRPARRRHHAADLGS